MLGHLSEYQIMVRQQLELFEATTNDIECNTQGRKRPVVLHQVGLRCYHCSYLPLRSRGRGAVYYPAKLQGIYQAAQNMALSHLITSCPKIPDKMKVELNELRQRRDNANGGKQYWADGCRALGVIETENDGLRFVNRALQSSAPPPQQLPQSFSTINTTTAQEIPPSNLHNAESARTMNTADDSIHTNNILSVDDINRNEH
jgi:hypothetical protein